MCENRLWRRVAPRGAFAVCLVLLAPSRGSSQSIPVDKLGVDGFGLEDGLPGMFVPDMALTGDGLLWLLASGHLVSFDGLAFEEHDLAQFPSADRTLRGIARGRADSLWVIVGQELFAYAGGRSSRRAEHESVLRDVWQDGNGELWGWDDRGALRLGAMGFERVARLAAGWNLGSATERNAEAPDNLWLHVMKPGSLWRIDAQRVLDPLPFPGKWPLPDPEDRTLLSWTGDDVTRVTRLDGTPVTTIPRDAGEWPLLANRQGLVWTQSPGAVQALDGSGSVVASLPLAPDARVAAAAEDAEGNLWLGTVTHGLFRIRPLPVQVIGADDGLTDRQVRRVSAGDRGDVLALDDRGRVYRIGTGGVDTVFQPSEEGGMAHAALVDRKGTLWLSLRSGEGDRLRGRTAEGETVVIPGILGTRIVQDPVEDGVLWFMGNGVLRIRPYATGGPVVEGPFFEHGWGARDLLVGPDGVAWLTGARGLARISAEKVEEFPVSEGFPSGGRALHRSVDGTIWIGRYSGGIVRYRDGAFGEVRAENGLWDDGVTAILEDGYGNLWMSSNRGVHRVARRDLDAFLNGEIRRVRGRGYGPDAGFQNAEASGWPGTRSPDGRLWFPTFSGVAMIEPREVLASEQTAPGIRIRGVQTEEERFAADSALTLPRGQRRVDVAYGATLLSGHGGIRYQVLLEGVDPDWVDAGAQRQVTYGNLPPGRHVFKARAVSGAGVPSEEEARIAITVPPFFHETGTFTLLMAVAGGGALWLLYHLRMRQLQAREATLQKLVGERTRDLARSQKETQAALTTVEAQAKELRSLDEAKSRFFANVSHELRTPLTLVQGPLRDVLDGRLGRVSREVREQVETVLASGRRLGELVEQLLDVARLESGEMRLNVRTEDLRPLLDRLAASFGALARRRAIDFDARVPEGAVLATVDADRMEKVYGNLLSNALRFTPEGGCVAFIVDGAEGEAAEVVVTVEDDGPGIPHGERERIFERFHQVDGSSRRAHGGTGLGLSLVKEITELHGGSVEVWSERGRGSRFTVRVPKNGATAPGPAPGTDAPPPSSPCPTETPAPGAADDDPDDTERPTVLVVEDHAELRAYLRRHLEERYRVVEAENGREGLEAARRAVPDVILCDIMMPELDGEDLCRAVRADPELSFLPVIMVTAKASRQSRLSALGEGADDYLVKPFDPEELRLRIGNLLKARRRLAERLLEEGKPLRFVPLDWPEPYSDDDFVTRLDALLRERMDDEDFDVTAMARALAMSRATLYRKFDSALSASPMELLWAFRLKNAAHWLRETDATVSEVAYACGFKTVPHFTRRFKQEFGTTPARYRTAR